MDTYKAWPDRCISYELTGARIVAIVVGGGALVETMDLRYDEGRMAMAYSEPHDYAHKPPELEPLYSFTQTPDVEHLASELIEASIVIDGAYDDGQLEIRGKGWIGYDDNGRLSGWFDEPPQMLLDTLPEREPGNDDDWSVDKWEREMGKHPPLPTAQFDRACRGRPDMPDD